MIKISVDTEEELKIVRRVLETEACSHSSNCQGQHTTRCKDCVKQYCENKVGLYKKEVVEIPSPLVV